MKSILKRMITLTLAALACLTLASCGVTLQAGEEGLRDERHDISYVHASTAYEAISLVKEYGKLQVTETESYALFTIPGMDPTEMLATEDFNIVYASDYELPTLMDMTPTILRVCSDAIEIKRLENAVTVAAIVGDYTNGENLPYPGTTPIRNYKVRFESVQYPGFYYTLTYVEYADDLEIDGKSYGKYFLYNAFDQRFVPVGDEIHGVLGLE